MWKEPVPKNLDDTRLTVQILRRIEGSGQRGCFPAEGSLSRGVGEADEGESVGLRRHQRDKGRRMRRTSTDCPRAMRTTLMGVTKNGSWAMTLYLPIRVASRALVEAASYIPGSVNGSACQPRRPTVL
jgi:hypothetical protein